MVSDDSMSAFCLDELWDCKFKPIKLIPFNSYIHLMAWIYFLHYSEYDMAFYGARFHQMFPFHHTCLLSLCIYMVNATPSPVLVRRRCKDPTPEKMGKDHCNQACNDHYTVLPLCGSVWNEDSSTHSFTSSTNFRAGGTSRSFLRYLVRVRNITILAQIGVLTILSQE